MPWMTCSEKHCEQPTGFTIILTVGDIEVAIQLCDDHYEPATGRSLRPFD